MPGQRHDVLDETYARFLRTGPEFHGYLSNHGPMAADALIRLGRADQVDAWVDRYLGRLEEPPLARWSIAEPDWREFLGDASRLGDWCAFFAQRVHLEPWTELLSRWWPRLLPGAVAAASHGLIRTGHVVRALRDEVTAPRLEELGQALGYWAARWQPLPPWAGTWGVSDVAAALDELPIIGGSGGARTRLTELGQSTSWAPAVRSLRQLAVPAEVPQALDQLVDAAVSRYRAWGHGSPIMLVHAATAPRAASLVLPALPRDSWLATYSTVWAVVAALSSVYRSPTIGPPAGVAEGSARSVEEVTELAVGSGDEHAIKFAEVALESHHRGNIEALPASARASVLIANDH